MPPQPSVCPLCPPSPLLSHGCARIPVLSLPKGSWLCQDKHPTVPAPLSDLRRTKAGESRRAELQPSPGMPGLPPAAAQLTMTPLSRCRCHRGPWRAHIPSLPASLPAMPEGRDFSLEAAPGTASRGQCHPGDGRASLWGGAPRRELSRGSGRIPAYKAFYPRAMERRE